ncbi:MAG: hypothetical protein FGF48_06380 [Candidatus Brockarchaeota archaeon]|nr:hypothetical protein [Candidatus Brockarchaeota archaeon]
MRELLKRCIFFEMKDFEKARHHKTAGKQKPLSDKGRQIQNIVRTSI